jgi:GntR family transcriptional regulator
MSLKRKKGIPLYLQVKENLLQKIDAGTWGEESLIPTESELCEEYGVSKITVREAVRILVKDGRLSRKAGKGTFVTKPKIEQKLNRFFSFTKWALENGLQPASRILRVEAVACDRHIARHLGIKEGEQVRRIERLRLGNGEPLTLEVIWVPCRLCPDLHLHDLANVPLNDILQNEYGIPLIRATESIEAATADEYLARQLAIDKDVVMLHVEHTAFTRGNQIVYFVTTSYRGDRVRFSVQLSVSRNG